MLNLQVDGAKLRTLREASGLSVKALAEKVGCSNWHIYRIESGHGQPGAETYGAIKKALKADDTDLLAKGDAA